MRSGRHGSMPSGELESLIARNGEFITVRRAGSGDGLAGVYNSVSCEFILAIHGGTLPEFSRMMRPKQYCECSPGKSACSTAAHGTNLRRGWRNCLYELVSRGRVRPTKEIKRVLGSYETQQARDYGQRTAPMSDPTGSWEYSGVRTR